MTVYAFGSFRLDDQARELRRDGAQVDLQPKAFDLLVHLVRNRDRVLGKDELLDAVWKEVVVSESSLSFGVKLVRKALGDGSQIFVKTIHGRGFRFVADCALNEPGRSAQTDASAPAALPFAPYPSVLVGRAVEMAALTQKLDESMQGSGRLLLVSGDAGIGKTRLACELATRAAARGAAVLLGACDENSPPAFWPWLPVLRRIAETMPDVLEQMNGAERAELARLLPALASRDEPVRENAELRHEGLRLHRALAGLLAHAAAVQPLVLVLDDVQWADAASLLALQLVIARTADLPVLVLAIYREGETEPDHPLTAFLETMEQEQTDVRLRVEGLSESESRSLLEQLVETPAETALAGEIGRLTDGNPFFVEEIVHHLDEETLANISVAGAGAAVIGVREIVERRLARLDRPCVHALTAAAVAGREFSFDVLCSAIGLSADAGEEAIEEAMAARIVQVSPSDPARFRFRHALLREVLYARTAAVRRAELHRAVGEAIEVVVPALAEGRAEELAHHFLQSGTAPDKAVGYAQEAGERALARQAYLDAAQRFEQASVVLERSFSSEPARIHDALMRTGDAYQLAGDGQRSRSAYHRAAECARAAGDSRRLLLAATADRSRRPFSGFELHALHEEAAAIAVAASASVPRGLAARAISRLAATLYNVPGSLDRRETLAEQALSLSDADDDLDSRVVVLDNVAMALWRPEHARRRIELAQEQERLARKSGAIAARLGAMVWAISAHLECGELGRATAEIDRFVPDAARSRLPAFQADVTMFSAMRAFMDCRFEQAEILVAEALARGHDSDEVAPSIRFGALMMALRAEQGRADEILPMLHVLEEQMPDLPWAYSFADLYAQSGDMDTARSYFDQVAAGEFAGLRVMEGHSLWLPSVFIVARACKALSRAQDAQWLYDRVLPYADRWAVIGQGTVCLGSMEHALGLLAATSGDTTRAVSHLESALSRHESEGALLPSLRSRLELAALLRSGGARAGKRATALLQEARAAALRVGHERMLAEIAQIA